MRLHVWAVMLVGLLPVDGTAQQRDYTWPIDLDEAVARALSVAPQVRIAEGQVLSARGFRAESLWPLSDNPIVEFERARRRSFGSESYDYGWRFSQQLEIAGQSFLRRGAANRRVKGPPPSPARARALK